MAKSFSNAVALNFISSAQTPEKQTATEQKPAVAVKPAKPAKAEKKPVDKAETAETAKAAKAPKSTAKSQKSVAKTTKVETVAKQEKPIKPVKPAKKEEVTPQTPDFPMLNLNIPVVERKSTRVQLLIKPSLVEKLKSIAKSKNTSVNDLVNVILETVLK